MEVGAKVYHGRVIVTDGDVDEKITIKAGKNIKLKINDTDCEPFKVYEVTSNDKIECDCEKTESKRMADIRISNDKMKAYIKVAYLPEIRYKLKERETFLNLAIAAEEESRKDPPHFSPEEIKAILNTNGNSFISFKPNTSFNLSATTAQE